MVERLFQGESVPLEVNGIYDRPFFHTKIKELYRQINDFQGYYRRWGAVQSFWLYYKLGDRTIQQQYAQSRDLPSMLPMKMVLWHPLVKIVLNLVK